MIKWQAQARDCCGQTCIAMIENMSQLDVFCLFEEVAGRPNGAGCTYTRELVAVLRHLGYKTPDRLIRTKKGRELPDNCIVKMNFYVKGERRNIGHWILRWEGRFYDPQRPVFHMPANGKFTSYLTIEEE